MTRRRTDYSVRTLEIRLDDHVQGPPDASVTLLEYGDYECPYCGEAHPIVKQLQRKVGDNMALCLSKFSLTSVHPHAEEAAEAAEAAGAQGKFWEMHDGLYEHQNELARPQLIRHAQRLSLDVGKLEDEVDRHVYMPRVREDFTDILHQRRSPRWLLRYPNFAGSCQDTETTGCVARDQSTGSSWNAFQNPTCSI